jgi:hypothetical protein
MNFFRKSEPTEDCGISSCELVIYLEEAIAGNLPEGLFYILWSTLCLLITGTLSLRVFLTFSRLLLLWDPREGARYIWILPLLVSLVGEITS